MARIKGSKNKKPRKEVLHASAEHAPWPPSGFEKLANCTASILEEKNEPDQEYAATKVGEYAHDIWEHCLYNPKTMDAVVAEKTHEDNLPDYVEAGEVEDLKTHPRNFAKYVLNINEKLQPWRFEIEQRVELMPKVWGRMDIGGAYKLKNKETGKSEDALYIADYKHGRWYSVGAEANWQLIIYALAFARKIGIEPVKTTLIVYQPRVVGEETVRKHVYTWPELLGWEARIKEAARQADAVQAGKAIALFKAGKWCQFCKAKYKCKEFKRQGDVEGVIDVAVGVPATVDSTFTDAEVLEVKRRAPKIYEFLRAVDNYLLQRAGSKNPVPGTKPVEGMSKRRWEGKPSEIAEYVETLGVKDPVETIKKLRGIGSIEADIVDLLDDVNFKSAAAKKREAYRLLQSVTFKPEGKLTFVLEDDPRPAIDLHDGRILKPQDLIEDLE
jgi:hypothetical protein